MCCIIIDLGYKIVKKDHSYDLSELQLIQLAENLGATRKENSTSFKFGSLILGIFIYVHNLFPTIRQIVWDKTMPITEKINGYIE